MESGNSSLISRTAIFRVSDKLSSVSRLLVRNSPWINTFAGTAFLTDPPSILPILNVVSLSNLPWGNLFISLLAIIIADNPFSGSAPACAALPTISISKLIYVGLELVIVLGGPSPSNIIALEPSNFEKSNC